MTIAQAIEVAVQHHQAGRLPEAEAMCRQILAVDPQHGEALHRLGVIAFQCGQGETAVNLIERAIAANPAECVHYPNNLGLVLASLGRLDEAIASHRRAIAGKPDFPEAWNNLGNALRAVGQLDEAIAAYRHAISLMPEYASAWNNLGSALNQQRKLDEAVSAFSRAIEIQPELVEAHANLGNAFKDRGQLNEAMASYRQAVTLSPADTVLHSNLVYSALSCPGYDAAALRAENAHWQKQHADPLQRFIKPHRNVPDPVKRLKVGYVSPDFWHHVACHFLTPLLERHDHAAFEIICYASVKRPDAVTTRMKRSSDTWRDVFGLRDEALADLIREDGIDILVDLSQHTAGNRLPVFARKPAPVQVAWLGYPGTNGLHAMDWRMTDACLEPEGSPWSESVEEAVRLPDSWFCFDPIDEYPEPGELPALRAGHVTFGSLNNFSKVSEAVLLRWAGVLRTVEGSRLLLQCPAGETQARVRRFLEGQGIGAERLEMVTNLPARSDFLKLFERIDIALDPFPYNGATTTCEALWMGIPVLTLPGSVIVSRFSLSIISACGMPEFIAGSEADYLSLAASLAHDLPRLSQLRRSLRERMKSSPFMDASRFARNVEDAYRRMWRTWCAMQGSPFPEIEIRPG